MRVGTIQRVALPLVFLASVSVGAATALGHQLSVPTAALVALTAGGFAVLAGLRHPWTPLGLFLAWLPFEDLFRKLAGNDLRLYAVKDILFVLVLIALAPLLSSSGAWRAALRGTRVPLLLLIGWAVIRSFASGIDDWRVPVVGLRLDFFYLPLVAVGYLLAQNADRLRRVFAGLSIVTGFAMLVGVIQAVFNANLFTPSDPIDDLPHLALLRGGNDVVQVFQPSGTFVDTGRYGQMALVAVAIALCTALLYRRGVARLGGVLAVACAGVAVLTSLNRSAVLMSTVLLLAALVWTRESNRSKRLRRVVFAASLGAVTLIVMAWAFPSVVEDRSEYYSQTLDPREPTNEWSLRWELYTDGIRTGWQEGGMLGRGTGQQSLGRQYLGEPEQVAEGPSLESGYGTVLAEWGLLGLVLWLTWSVAWVRQLARGVRATAGSSHNGVAVLLTVWVFLILFVNFALGIHSLQNFVSNAFVWLFSGMVFGLGAVHAPEPQVPELTRA